MATDFDYSTLQAEDVEFTQPSELNAEDVEQQPDQPTPSITAPGKRTRRAIKYEKEVGNFLGSIASETLSHPATVADGAALLYYTPKVARAWGDLADADDNVRKGIDFVIGGSENPYAAAVFATLPLVLQVVRNHEPVAEGSAKAFRIPFTKREFKWRFRIRIQGWFRNVFTHDPKVLTDAALTPPVIRELEANGVRIAKPKWRSNGD